MIAFLSRNLSRKHIAIIGVAILAIYVRAVSAMMLPVGADEPTYLVSGYEYAQAIREKNLYRVIDNLRIPEHPALVMITYGMGWLVLGDHVWFSDGLFIARVISAFFGTLSVLTVSLIDPLAGGLLALHTVTMEYNSMAFLEAMPQFTSLAALLTFAKATSIRDRRFWLSAIMLGMTAAGKYTYLFVLFPIMYLFLYDKKGNWKHLVAYLVIAALFFWMLNPTLWHDPVQRLWDSLFFHLRYSASEHVQRHAYPWYQPILWLSRPVFGNSKTFPAFDFLTLALAFPGIYLEWQKGRRWIVVWFLASLIALFWWPAKWPQYTLILTPALCMLAARTIKSIPIPPGVLSRLGQSNKWYVAIICMLCIAIGTFAWVVGIWHAENTHAIPHPRQTFFGTEIQLLGYSLIGMEEKVACIGDSLTVYLFWQTSERVRYNYTVSVQLIGTEYNPLTKSPLWAQDDHMPLRGAYPTSWWLVGIPFKDHYRLQIAQNTPPGEYQIVVVMYSYENLERLPVRGYGANAEFRYALLKPIRIVPCSRQSR